MKNLVVGGQAVIEGVMMRSPNFYSVAIRRSSGEIEYKSKRFRSVTKAYPFLAWPFIRGLVTVYEMLSIGFSSLRYSSDVYAIDHGEKPSTKSMKVEILISVIISILLGFLLFVLLPLWLTNLTKVNSFSYNLVDGGFKLLIFIGYIVAISFMRDVRRVFQYHGAEHKSVYNYESGESLSLDNVRKFSTLHPRCGTNFAFIVILISLVVISLFHTETFGQRIMVRVFTTPLVISLSYELLRALGDGYPRSPVLKALLSPGLILQKLTTKEPDDRQLEVALVAIKEVLELESKGEI